MNVIWDWSVHHGISLLLLGSVIVAISRVYAERDRLMIEEHPHFSYRK